MRIARDHPEYETLALALGGRADRVASAFAVGPTQVVVDSVVERRHVSLTFTRVSRDEPLDDEPELEPWAEPFDVPDGATEWETTRKYPQLAYITNCPGCRDGQEEYLSTTTRADGTTDTVVGYRSCSICSGSLRCSAVPVIKVILEGETATRVLERAELPIELLIEVGEGFDDGVLVFEETDVMLEPRGTGGVGAYRGRGPRVDAEVDDCIDELLVERREALGDAKCHRQRLRVLSVPIYRVLEQGGDECWVYRNELWHPKRAALLSPLTRSLIAFVCIAAFVALLVASAC